MTTRQSCRLPRLCSPGAIMVAFCCCCSCCRGALAADAAVASVYAEVQHLASSLTARVGRDASEASRRLLAAAAFRASPAETLWRAANGRVSDKCAEEIQQLLDGLARVDAWSLAFADSLGKPPAGLLNGATTWLGSFDQCLAAATDAAKPLNIIGAYCLLKLNREGPLQNATLVTLGSCWPSGCSMSDAVNATSAALGRLLGADTGIYAAPGDTRCRISGLRAELTVGAVAMIALLGTIAVCLTAGTAIELYERSLVRRAEADAAVAPPSDAAASVVATSDAALDSSGNAGDEEALVAAIRRDNHVSAFRCLGVLRSVLLCFSIPANATKILNQQSQEGCLKCVNGIRFLSMSWVILGHTYLFGLLGVSNLGQLVPRWLNDWTFQAVLNATVAVDTFFVLSGLLATYLFMRELDMRRGQLKRINWFRFYLHRYWRLTAPYMIILGAYTTLAQYMFDGPRYPRDGFDKNCETTWWHNLLYINNLFSMGDMCMAWSWYLANDMQFYVISPLFLVPMALKPAFGAAVAAAVVLASTAAAGVHSTQTGQRAGFLTDTAINGDYTRPWFRIGPYLVGSLAGLLVHRVLAAVAGYNDGRPPVSRRLRLHWTFRLLGWCIALGLCASVLYGLYDVLRGRTSLSQPVASLYNATFRLAWSLGVAWVVLACATGNGGCVTEFLSAGWFAPLSRLSYCAYLLHPALMIAVETARRDTVQWNDWTPVGNYLSYLLATYAMAFGASLALESPLIGLERLALTGTR